GTRRDRTERVRDAGPRVLGAECARVLLPPARRALRAREGPLAHPPSRDQLVIRANTIGDVPAVEAAVKSLLKGRRLTEDCDGSTPRSFCLRLPERNNFQAAFQEQSKVGAGGAVFFCLFVALVAGGGPGLRGPARVAW